MPNLASGVRPNAVIAVEESGENPPQTINSFFGISTLCAQAKADHTSKTADAINNFISRFFERELRTKRNGLYAFDRYL
jgi:hypothetical protein